MIDPQSITYQETTVGSQLVIVGQICLTEAVTLDTRAVAASDIPRHRILSEIRAALLVQLWSQAYGEMGRIIAAIETQARQGGELGILNLCDQANALLRPACPRPVVPENLPTDPHA